MRQERDVEVGPIAEGLWRWASRHPEWTPEQGGDGGWEADVASLYLEGDDAVVLIDPLVPTEAESRTRFWRALDRDLERLADRPLVLLLSCAWHRRSLSELNARYAPRPGTRVLAHAESAAFLVGFEPVAIRERERLPGGVEGRLVQGPEPVELAFWIPAHATLFVADGLIGAGGGRLRVCPPAWLGGPDGGGERLRSQLRPRLEALLELPVERVVPSHGEPVLERGRDALAAALEAPPWGA